MTDLESIIQNAKRGRKRSLRKLFDTFYLFIYKVIYRYAQDHQYTEDLVSVTFEKIFRNLHKFTKGGESAFRKWIKTIAINEALRRQKKEIQIYLQDDLEVMECYEESQDENVDFTQDILRAVNELPVGYRTIFMLHTLDGLTHTEIAEHLGISRNTSKSQLLKARETLKNKLSYGRRE